MKVCSHCGLEKPLDEFPKHKRGKDGCYAYCKKCAAERSKSWRQIHGRFRTFEEIRRYNLAKKFGMTPGEADILLEKANHMCQICGNRDNLCIDHNHKTGVIRGILCNKCNTVLGYVGGSTELLKKLIEYLEKERKEVDLFVLMNQMKSCRF